MLGINTNNLKSWLKVSDLRVGMQIAVPKASALSAHGSVLACENYLEHDQGDVMWDEIVEIKHVGEERVYDIEVEGTHNFVAGHLIDQETNQQLSIKEEKEYLEKENETDNKKKAWFGALFAHNTYLNGNATTTGSLVVGDPTGGGMGSGTVNAEAYYTNGADYAEYFWTEDESLEPGDAVSIDITSPKTVKKSDRQADPNVIGIVSTKPAIIGNTDLLAKENSGLSGKPIIIGLIGQVPAKVSAENGAIRPGDSLTPGILPGVLVKATAGDSTVGVALENFDQIESTGQIKVLISRRNKSLTVSEVEEAITERVANMEIEDEVNLLIAGAMDELGVEEQITELSMTLFETQSELTQMNMQANFSNVGIGTLTPTDSVGEIKVLGDMAVSGNMRIADKNGVNIISINPNSTSTSNVILSEALIQGQMKVAGTMQVEHSAFFGGTVNFAQGSLALRSNVRELNPSDLINGNYGLGTGTPSAPIDLDSLKGLPEVGDIVVVDPEQADSTVKSYSANLNSIVGVVTDSAAGVLRGETITKDSTNIAISGTVRLKVSLENGDIKKGDLLSTGSVPGHAAKAIYADAGIIGIALEDFNGETTTKVVEKPVILGTASSTIDFSASTSTPTSTIEEIVPEIPAASISVLLTINNKVSHDRNSINNLLNRDQENLTVSDNENNQDISVVDASNLDENNEEIVIRPVTIFGGDLEVMGLVTFSENLFVRGGLTIEGTLLVRSDTTLEADLTLEQNLNLEGAIVKTYEEAEDEYLEVGDAVYVSTEGTLKKAYADNPEFKPAIGLVVGFEFGQSGEEKDYLVKVAIAGTVDGFKGLSIGSTYYLSDLTTSLELTEHALASSTDDQIALVSLVPVAPTDEFSSVQAIAVADSASSLLIMPSLSYIPAKEITPEQTETETIIYNNYIIEQLDSTPEEVVEEEPLTEEIPEEIIEEEEPLEETTDETTSGEEEVIEEETASEEVVEGDPEPVEEIVETPEPVIEVVDSEPETEIVVE
jgi:hypothetical protein